MAAWVWYDQISIQLTANLSGVALAGGGAAGVAKRYVGGQALGAETLFFGCKERCGACLLKLKAPKYVCQQWTT